MATMQQRKDGAFIETKAALDRLIDHHPKDVGLAEEWVRRLSAAWKAIGITADHATHLLRD